MPLLQGTRLGPYEILGLLKTGGMGAVYRARDHRLARDVAVKILPEDVAGNPERIQRFEREARVLAALNHPNILTIYDVGAHEGTPFVVFELLEGETLREVIAGRSPSISQILAFAVEIAHGLEAAHSKGIIHRDLKPENLFVANDGRVKILDFGLAKLVSRRDVGPEEATLANPSHPGELLGTPSYMSPEQVRGVPVDHRSDIFSLGVVLYETLSGEHPFRKDTNVATLAAILSGIPRDLSCAGRGVPPAIAGIVRRCLEKAPEDRFPLASDLAGELQAVLSVPSGSPALFEVDDKSPYPGLSSFAERDAALFFGRETEIAALWSRIQTTRMLAVIGPSGAGKTSFVRAGVLASRPETWGAIVCTPGAAPLRSLGQSLAPELSGNPQALRKLVGLDDSETASELVTLWRAQHGDALLVVDQFEELFTLHGPDTQADFASLLGRIAEESGVHVLLSLRDDFLIRCADHTALAPVFRDLTPLSALSPEGLRRAIVEPARKRGYRFDDDTLVEEMVGFVANERAALPLVAFAVSQLWESRDRENKVLTRLAYEAAGGVGGALAQHAERTLGRIGTERQAIVREIFQNLVTSHGTRASAEWEDLLSPFTDRLRAESVLRELIDARLLTSYEKDGIHVGSSARRVEIVHESLLKAWPRLVRWQSQDQEGAVLRDQLRQAAHLWNEKGRSSDFLWTGTAYGEFKLWRERYRGALTAVEEAYAQSMQAKAQRATRRRLLGAAAAFLTMTAIAVVFGISRQEAVRARDRAEASKLLALAELELQEDPTVALAYATASLEVADSEEARVFVMRALWEAPPALELPAGTQSVRVPAFSPDGKWLATAGHSTEALVWSEDGEGPIVLPGHEVSPRGPNYVRWFSNDLLVTGSNGHLGTRANVWSMPEGKRVRTIDFDGPTAWQLGPQRLFTETLESGTSENMGVAHLRAWPLPDGDPVSLGRVDLGSFAAFVSFFATNGRSWFFVKDRTLFDFDLPVITSAPHRFAEMDSPIEDFWFLNGADPVMLVAGGIHLMSFPPEGPPSMRVLPQREISSDLQLSDPQGRWVCSRPTSNGRLNLWDYDQWSEARPLALRRDVSWYIAWCSFSPSADWVVASTERATNLDFWPLRRTYPTVVDSQNFLHRPLAFSPDGKWLASRWGERELRLWPLPGSGETTVRTLELPELIDPTTLVFSPQNKYLFVVSNRQHAWMLPLNGAPPQHVSVGSEDATFRAGAVSPSGRLVATAFWYGEGDKNLSVWDVETGELRRFALPTEPGGDGKSPTGYEGGVTALAFGNESTLYTLGDGGLRRWNLDTGSSDVVAKTASGNMMAGVIHPRRGVAITVEKPLGRLGECIETRLQEWTTGASRTLREFGDCDTGLFQATLDASGTVAAIANQGGIVRVGRLDGSEPHLLVGHRGAVDRVAISPDLRWVATTGEDNTLRLWPMPDLSKPPLHTLPHEALLAKLRSLTNFRVVRDPSSAEGWKVEIGPFPGWRESPVW